MRPTPPPPAPPCYCCCCRRAAQVLPMRAWQLVPGTPGFVVDRFCNLPQQVRGRGGAALQPLQLCSYPGSPAVQLCSYHLGAVCCWRDSTVCLHSVSPCPPPRLQSPYRHWFLTHFHADHYKGLTGK